MDAVTCGAVIESPPSEAPIRPYRTEPLTVAAMQNHLSSRASHVLSQLIETFAIPESGVGIQALLHELRADLLVLRKIFAIPDWAIALEDLRISLVTEFGDDSVRDLASVRSQPKNGLRDYLAPLNTKLSPDRQRAVRAMRGAVTLKLIASHEQISTSLADEIKRWLSGDGPASLTLQNIRPQQLWTVRQSYPCDSLTARLVTHLIEALEARLDDPFKKVGPASTFTAPATQEAINDEEDGDKGESSTPASQNPPDPLRGFVAEAGNAGVRLFSGVPTFHGMHPGELEMTMPQVIQQWRGNASDEGLAALLTLFTRILPSGFGRLPISADGGAGIWVDVTAGHVCWNLDEVISSHNKEKPFKRSSNDRFVRIPLPGEVANDLRSRLAKVVKARTIDQLFTLDMENLAKATKSMLRRLALSSHRPTLTRLSRTWARYILALCQDEVYAAAIGIDFTIGTSANFNYAMLLGTRLLKILPEAYKRVGLSGELPTGPLGDVGSLWLPDVHQVASFVESAINGVARTIRSLPRRTSKRAIQTAHNEVSVKLYAVFMLLLGSRPLSEETITRSRIDCTTGIGIKTDKRTAPYHERRLVCLAPTLRAWLQLYIAWLQLLAYRMASEDRNLSGAIASVINLSLDGDGHPLFFRFMDDGQVAPLGSADLEAAYTEFGIKNNGGRHFLDWLLRKAGIDSAAIMAWAGRGNPGQECFGSWSAAVPLAVLGACANVIEDWLGTLSLPPVPKLQPRPLPTAVLRTKRPAYIPKLLQSKPDWASENENRLQEPCPFLDSTVTFASLYAEFFRMWRRRAPPEGWLGVALSLIFEDGVFHEAELGGMLKVLQQGTLYRHHREFFGDSKSDPLGIRRVWVSETTIRLLYQVDEAGEAQFAGEDLDHKVDEFLSVVRPDAKGKGLTFIMACGRAFYSLRVPGVLFGWMSGSRFARTSRPETVARHLIGAIEHPKFDVRRRRRGNTRTPEVIRRAMTRCARKVRGGSSHASQLSWLCGYLNAIFPDLEVSSHESLVAGYLVHLCAEQKNIFTVVRYESGARTFLEKAADAIAKIGFSQVDWRLLIDSCLVSENEAFVEGPNRTSINHALNWMGIDIRIYRRKGPPQSAYRYAEFPSAREREIAVGLLDAQQTTVGDDWHLAATALMLLFEHPHRWDDVSHLRLCDAALDVEHPHLVITLEAGGALKTDNAPRVLFLRDGNLVARLKAICAQRQSRFPDDPLVPIFGDDGDPRINVAAARIHDLLGEALRCATGSPIIRVHDTRDAVISREIADLMAPDGEGCTGRALHSRQAMFRISVDTGHGAPDVSVENYGNGLDVLRRRWVTRINGTLDCPPSIAFLSKVTGVPAATYRKRLSRNSSATHDLFENFGNDIMLRTEAKVVLLSSLVICGQEHLPLDSNSVDEGLLTGAALYVGLRLLGESRNDARLASRLTEAYASRMDSGITAINRQRPITLASRNDINRETFIDAVIESGLVIAMHAAQPPRVVINRLGTAMPFAGDPWEFSTAEDALNLKSWFGVWKANGIGIEVVMKPGSSSAVDDYQLGQLRNAGVSRARHLPGRHFPRGVCISLRFLPAKEKNSSGYARASPQLAFLVTACSLSLLLQHQGD